MDYFDHFTFCSSHDEFDGLASTSAVMSDLRVAEQSLQWPSLPKTPASETFDVSGQSQWLQLPTPPSSDPGITTEAEPEENRNISVSTAFYPGACIDSLPSDVILASSDAVFFYVHSHRLLSCSSNGFNFQLPIASDESCRDNNTILAAPESSTVLNVVLHTIYNMPFAQYRSTFESLLAAVESLHKYGVSLKEYIAPSMPLYQHLVSVAPLKPIETYVMASQHGLDALAVAVSSHLLNFSLATLTDEMASRMGPVYLKRLFFLHLGRVDALRRILLPPPPPHPPTNTCNFTEQKQMVRIWALAAAYLAWDARPDLPISTIRQTINPLVEKLDCDVCRSSLQERVKTMIIQWSVVKNTI